MSDTRRLRLRYPTPYIRNLPIALTVQDSSGDENRTEVLGPDYRDPFRCELVHFSNAVAGRVKVKTPISGAVEDMRLIERIFETLRATMRAG